MSDLPAIWAKPDLPSVPLPRTNPNAYGAEAFGTLAQVAHQAAEQQKTIDVEKAMTEYDLGVADIKQGLTSEDDTSQWEPKFRSAENNLRQRLLGGIGDTSAKREFDRLAERSLSRHVLNVRQSALKIGNDQRIAYAERASIELSDQAAAAADSGDRGQLIGRAYGLFASLAQGPVPAISPVRAEELRQQFDHNLKNKRTQAYESALQGSLDDLVNRAYREPTRVMDIERDGMNMIRSAGSDIVPPDRVNKDRLTFSDAVWASAIRGKIDRDPITSLAELRAGMYDNKLKDPTLRTLRREAEVEIERINRELEAQRRGFEKQVGKQVNDYKAAVTAGFPWSGNLGALERDVKGTEHEAEFVQARKDASELYLFNQMGPAEQENHLRALAQTGKSGADAKLYAKLEAAHSATVEGLAKDPITFAIRRGVIPNSLGPFNLNDPASLKARSMAADMVEARYRQPVSPLSDDESRQLVSQFASIPADQRVVTMKQLNDNFTPHQIVAIARQLAKNGSSEMSQVFGIASRVPEAASRVMQGIEIKKSNPDTLPKNKTLLDEYINRKMGDAYQASPDSYAAAKEAVKSAYAWASWKTNDLSGSLSSERLDNAITTVTGGLIPFNGQLTLPPRYQAKEKDLRDMIAKANFSNVKGTIGAKDVLSYGKLTAVGPGLYRVTIGGSPVFDKNGKPFELDLSR